MKVMFISCPHCGKRFYSEMLLVENRLPMHCGSCDAYIEYEVYTRQLAPAGSSALARIKKPLNEQTIPEILYIPDRKDTAAGGRS